MATASAAFPTCVVARRRELGGLRGARRRVPVGVGGVRRLDGRGGQTGAPQRYSVLSRTKEACGREDGSRLRPLWSPPPTPSRHRLANPATLDVFESCRRIQ
jgi:hypothetical protein